MSKRLQGDQGEAIAVLHYIRTGCIVSVPTTEESRYDLIIDRAGKLFRVQVKTTSYMGPDRSSYRVGLRTNGGNYTQKNVTKKIKSFECDLVFVISGDGRCWEFPVEYVEDKSELTLNTKKESFLVGKYAPLV